jgi:hypothetical protein
MGISMSKHNNVIRLLKDSLEQFRNDPSVKQFKGGTFTAWAENVKAILSQVPSHASKALIYQFAIATKDLPIAPSIVIAGHLRYEFESIFEDRLPNVEKTLENIILQLENFSNEKSNIIKVIGDLIRARLHKTWQWIETHRILTALYALGAIASIIGLVFLIINL